MSTTLRERREQMLRDEITDAARALLTEKGYAAMSVEELATRVGISKPTLYKYVPGGKDELVVNIVVSHMQRMLDALNSLAPGESPLRRLTLFLRRALEIQCDDHSAPLRIITPELIHLLRTNDACHAIMRHADAAVLAMFRQAQEQGEIDTALDPVTLSWLFGALTAVQRFGHFSTATPPSPATMLDTLLTFFERGLRAPRAD
jgi:AcrR family transcriptional regulator